MTLDLPVWIGLPPEPWNTTLFATSVATLSATVAVYAARVAAWEAELRAAVDRVDRQPDDSGKGVLLAPAVAEALGRDPQNPVGWIALVLAAGLLVSGLSAASTMNQGIAWAIVPLLVAALALVYLVIAYGAGTRRRAKEMLKRFPKAVTHRDGSTPARPG